METTLLLLLLKYYCGRAVVFPTVTEKVILRTGLGGVASGRSHASNEQGFGINPFGHQRGLTTSEASPIRSLCVPTRETFSVEVQNSAAHEFRGRGHDDVMQQFCQ